MYYVGWNYTSITYKYKVCNIPLSTLFVIWWKNMGILVFTWLVLNKLTHWDWDWKWIRNATKKTQKNWWYRKWSGSSTKTKTKKKPLDNPSTSTAESVEASSTEFTVGTVLKSYENPRCDLFNRSLNAELDRHPELQTLTPEDGALDPPDILFGKRRKGYFKCKHLCRVWTLETLRWLRSRGEFFVVWDDGEYDGRLVLAHAFTIKYISLHQPGLSVVFDQNGALKSTQQIFTKIRKYFIHTHTHMYALSWRAVHGRNDHGAMTRSFLRTIFGLNTRGMTKWSRRAACVHSVAPCCNVAPWRPGWDPVQTGGVGCRSAHARCVASWRPGVTSSDRFSVLVHNWQCIIYV